jgi:hypothetical protein
MASGQRIPRDANNRYVARALLVLIAVLVVGVPGYFEVAQPVLQGDAPAAAVRQMCADERKQDYVAVYALLAPSFIQQYQRTEATFVQSQQSRDRGYGPVVTCAITGRDYGLSMWNTGAVFTVTVTLGVGPAAYTDTGPIGLVDDHGWKISLMGIDAVLFFAG